MKTLSEYISESIVINEMANERQQFMAAVKDNLKQIVQNLIYIRYIGQYCIDWAEMYNSINHWKGELAGHIKIICDTNSGNNKYTFRKKAINQTLQNNGWTNINLDNFINDIRIEIQKDPKHKIKIPNSDWADVLNFVKTEIDILLDFCAKRNLEKARHHIKSY